jgi:hypothetical protein
MRIPEYLHFSVYALCAATLLLVESCKTNPVDAGNPTIQTGETKQLVTQTIGSSGGKLGVTAPGDSLDGLEVAVPAGAYGDSRTFTISSAPIVSHQLGEYFNPVSPLITISNGGGYSEQLMTLRIPVHVPAGHFAMAFLYDKQSGKLEGMPLLESDSDHVTVFTRNFNHSALTGLGKPSSAAAPDVGLSEIVVASVDENVLLGDIQSDFKVGVDNWQFVNWGSYTSPGGNCSGHSMGMLWYYSQKKKSGGQLYGRFDNDGTDKTPGIWEDDAAAIKFVSALQTDWSFSPDNLKLIDWQWKNDWKTEKCFAYSILVTKEPQLMLVTDPNGIQKGSHAVMVYRVLKGMLFIADPNFPFEDGQFRRAEYDPKLRLYGTYYTGPNGSQTGFAFTDFVYLAKTSVGSWTSAATHWQELASGTIGEGKFPSYRIVARNASNDYVPLTDGMSLTSPITVDVIGDGFPAHFVVFERPNTMLSNDQRDIELTAGDHLLGFCIADTVQCCAPASIQHWIGFKWVKVKITGEDPNAYTPPERGKLTMSVSDTRDGAQQIDSADYLYDFSNFIIGWRRHGCAASGLVSLTPITHAGTYPLNVSVNINKECFNEGRDNGSVTISQWKDGFAGNFTFDYYKHLPPDYKDSTLVTVTGSFSYP